MIQFDELETLAQLWNITSRKNAYRMLHALTCFHNVWTIFAATERLNHLLISDTRSGKIKDQTSQAFLDQYFKYEVLSPPVIDQQLSAELLNRIERLYRKVYHLPKEMPQKEILKHWARIPFRNPRRLIRYAIDF